MPADPVRKNLVVDGSNLAYRAYHAMKAIPTPLTDSEGNPTGLVFGFLRSLSALVSRFDPGETYVVWDGSKQARTTRYAGYKANRNTENIFKDGQYSKICELLPLLGVQQVRNPDEEADDVVGSLVRGPLKGHHNVVVSTDRDFLQLVTYTDYFFVPKVGSRDEKLYGPDEVVAEYGIPPDRIVHLRALLGDSSDNLPGVPKVPEKLLRGLLRTHSTVQGVYASNLAGLSVSQYERVRSAKGQVLLNLELMPLRTVDTPTIGLHQQPNLELAAQKLAALGVQQGLVETFQKVPQKGFQKTS